MSNTNSYNIIYTHMVTNHNISVIVSATCNDEHNYYGTTILAIPIIAEFLESNFTLTEQQRAGLYTMTPLAGQKDSVYKTPMLLSCYGLHPAMGLGRGGKNSIMNSVLLECQLSSPTSKKL